MHRLIRKFAPSWLGLAMLAGIGGTAALAVWCTPGCQEFRVFSSVRLGMTEDELLAVLGKPPGRYGPPGAVYAGPCIFT